MSSGIPTLVFMGKEFWEREPLPGMLGSVCRFNHQVIRTSSQGWERSQSVARRVLSGPDPNPVSSPE